MEKLKKGQFIRSFHFESPDHKITGIFQPYKVGMYAAITDSKLSHLLQLNCSHKTVGKEFQKTFAKFMKEPGMEEKSVEIGNYSDWFTPKEIKDYIDA